MLDALSSRQNDARDSYLADFRIYDGGHLKMKKSFFTAGKAGRGTRMKRAVLVALFAAIISVGTFINFPLPGLVPITFQDMFSMTAGLLSGPLLGALSVLVFLALGCAGLPVFAGKAGIQRITQAPAGGFLIGYLAGAVAGGVICALLLPRGKRHSAKKSAICAFAAGLAATIAVFAFGIAGFMRVTGYDFNKTLAAALIPFIPGNTIKLIIMSALTAKFRPVITNYLGTAFHLNQEDEEEPVSGKEEGVNKKNERKSAADEVNSIESDSEDEAKAGTEGGKVRGEEEDTGGGGIRK